jgi:hypothetical protein
MSAQERDPWSVAGDVGQAGLRAAGAVVEQLLALSRRLTDVSMPISTFQPPGDDAAGPAHELRRLRADAERLIELYGDWTRALLDGFTELAEGRDGGDGLRAGPVEAGSTAVARAFVHVLDGKDVPEAALFATDLVAHDGSVTPGSSVTFAPAALGGGPPVSPSAAEVTVSIAVPPETPAGTYHGTVLARGLPEVHLALRLEVGP